MKFWPDWLDEPPLPTVAELRRADLLVALAAVCLACLTLVPWAFGIYTILRAFL